MIEPAKKIPENTKIYIFIARFISDVTAKIERTVEFWKVEIFLSFIFLLLPYFAFGKYVWFLIAIICVFGCAALFSLSTVVKYRGARDLVQLYGMLPMQAVVLVDKQIFAIQQVINLIACIGAAIFLSITVQRTMGS